MSDQNTVLLIQARMASSRLPGKVLKDICGKPMLQWVVERCRKAMKVGVVAVATTVDETDDPVELFCRDHGIPVYRGSQFDVLDRYYQAAKSFAAEIVVRVTADCPLIDPEEIDHVIEEFITNQADFAANRLPPPWNRTYPIGLDTEVCRFTGLELAWQEAVEPFEREHVMPHFYATAGKFKVHLVNHDPDYGAMRWTVDTSEDLAFIQTIFRRITNLESFRWQDILQLVLAEPQLSEINAGVKHKSGLDVDERMHKG